MGLWYDYNFVNPVKQWEELKGLSGLKKLHKGEPRDDYVRI
jgi:hypothetical protein